ncbi:MAG: chitobiase/beta-hexosaminidase C-terminal domain-containing protein [Lachnospiraceae bacterium]|nr:chitobiase/beta-hexosaminidase C-terminal domain-containing protein [Lachnospiraceae bacterium]
MRCKECGIEVDNSEVFCPNCGAPLRVTADYDFIQAEIGGKVDQFMNDAAARPERPREIKESRLDGELKTVVVDRKRSTQNNTGPELTIIGEKPRHESVNGDTIAFTKAIYGKDSVFSVDGNELYDEPIEEEDNEEDEKDSKKELSRIRARARERKRKRRKRIILFSIIGALVVIAAIAIIVLVSKSKKEPEEKDFSDRITANAEEGGVYSAPFDLTLWSEKDYRITYTLDGSEPNVNSVPYGQPIRFSNSDIGGDSMQVTLKAASYNKNGSILGGKITLNFTVTKSMIASPTMEPDSGDYYESEYIYIYGPEGADIYYTYDGSTPSKNSSLYTGPIQMKRGNYVLNAIAIDQSGVQSEVASYVYNLVIESNISEEYAFEVVLQDLEDSGLIESTEPDESGQYKVPGGGIRRVTHGGAALIENENYIIIQVNYSNDGGTVQATTYYGINDQTGELFRLNKSGMSYTFE